MAFRSPNRRAARFAGGSTSNAASAIAVPQRRRRCGDGLRLSTRAGLVGSVPFRNGRQQFESSGSEKETEAHRLLKLREGDIARGLPVTPKIGRMRYEEAQEDFLNDQRVNNRRSPVKLEARIKLHLEPFFRGSADGQHHDGQHPGLRGEAQGGNRSASEPSAATAGRSRNDARSATPRSTGR